MKGRKNLEMKSKVWLLGLGLFCLALGLTLLWQLLKKQSALFEFVED
jgi:hypothetical protein